MESGNKITKMATVSTKRLKMKKKLRKGKSARRSRRVAESAAGNMRMRRTLFFFNVPAWISEHEELIEVFRPVSRQTSFFKKSKRN